MYKLPIQKVKDISKHWRYILMGIIVLVLLITLRVKNSKIQKLRTENSISSVLLDTISVYKNKLGTVTYEKQAFSVKLSALKDSYERLDDNSKSLLDKIDVLEKEKLLLSASNIDQVVELDTVYIAEPSEVDTINNTITFKDSTEFFQYDFLVEIEPPLLKMNKISFPNELYISHKCSDQKDKILISVVNSSDYYKINNIDSYIIPMDKKKSQFKTYVTIGGVCIGIGAIGTLILLN